MIDNKDKNILVVGGGFGGARAAQELSRAGFTNVTLVDRKDYFEVTYATLRGVTDPEQWAHCRKRYTDFISGHFIRAGVVELADHEAILNDGTRLGFDFAVLAMGTSYPSFSIAKPLDENRLPDREMCIDRMNLELKSSETVLIIGGGPVGVEFAGEVASAFPEKAVTLIHDRDRLLDGFNSRLGTIAQRQLEAQFVRVVLNERVVKNDTKGAYISEKTGFAYPADVSYVCVGTRVQTGIMKKNFSHCLNGHGAIKVDSFLRVSGLDHIYAVGDCNNVPELKLGYLADIQGEKAAENLIRQVEGKKLKPFKPHPPLALIPTGRDSGVVQLPFGLSTTLSFIVNLKQKDLFIGRAFRNLGTRSSVLKLEGK